MQYSKSTSFISALCLAIGLTSAVAYAGDGYVIIDDFDSGSWDKEVGASFANATLDLYAYRSVDAAYSYSKGPLFLGQLYGRARLDGELLGVDFPIAQARGKSYLRTGYWNSSSDGSIYSASTTWNPDDYGKYYLFGFNLSWMNQSDGFGQVLEHAWYWTTTIASHTFWLGPVPVTVKAEAGALAGFKVKSSGLTTSTFNPSNPKAGLDAELFSYGVGILSGGVGVSWASAGVQADLGLGSSAFNVDVAVSKYGGSGSLKLVGEAIKLIVKLYAEVDLWF